MICKLCHCEKKLCKSHIIPELAYKSLYDDKHKIKVISNYQNKLPPIQKGLRELLLCKDCEEHLNEYEKYFNHAWFRNNIIPDCLSDELYTISGLDYQRFKLFHISILWRACIASREEFNRVNLTKEHEERLRQLILSNKPGTPNQYSIFGYVLVFPGNKVVKPLIVPPEQMELYNIPGFHFVFGGCIWHYLLSNDVDLDQFPYVLKNDGVLHMLRVNAKEYEPVMSLMRERLNRGWRLKKNK